MKDLLAEKFKKAKSKLILLDYDGTLVDYQKAPQDAIPSEKLLSFLLKLNDLPDTSLVIITGRAYSEIDGFIGTLPIDIVAEHGAMSRENGDWKELIRDKGDWKRNIIPVLDRFSTRCPGSFTEEKRFSLAWHYRNAELQTGISISRELIGALSEKAWTMGLKITDGNKVVEVKKQGIDKGKGTQYLLEKRRYDFILAMGDDKTDEDMFEVLANKDDAFTIKVGVGDTLAKYRLDNVQDVILLLNELL
ncbi:MAG: trehalose-phosphatase [Bacteroidota bacterium]|nr:trehalose-phosphatase [Bacteroidota bacterium]